MGEEVVGDRPPEEKCNRRIAIEPEEFEYPVAIQQHEDHQSEDRVAPQCRVPQGVHAVSPEVGDRPDQSKHHEDEEHDD